MNGTWDPSGSREPRKFEELVVTQSIGSSNDWVNKLARLGGGFKYSLFSSICGEMIQFDEHMFQMG